MWVVPQPRAEPEDQVVLGLPPDEKPAGALEELVGGGESLEAHRKNLSTSRAAVNRGQTADDCPSRGAELTRTSVTPAS